MPIQRRLPKRGFNSALARQTFELRLDRIESLSSEKEITLALLIERKFLPTRAKRLKVIQGRTEVTAPLHLKGIRVTASVAKSIAAAKGSVNP